MNQVQEVYRLQGVDINDKHIEIIVRQMLKKVRMIDTGDTSFLFGEEVDRKIFEAENQKISLEGGKPAQASPLLLGITKASLSTESFISAASFQDTTRILTQGAFAKVRPTISTDLRRTSSWAISSQVVPALSIKKVKKYIDRELEEPMVFDFESVPA